MNRFEQISHRLRQSGEDHPQAEPSRSVPAASRKPIGADELRRAEAYYAAKAATASASPTSATSSPSANDPGRVSAIWARAFALATSESSGNRPARAIRNALEATR